MNKLELLSKKLETVDVSPEEHAKVFRKLLQYRKTHIQEFQSFNKDAAKILTKLIEAKQFHSSLLERFAANQLLFKYIKNAVSPSDLSILNEDVLLQQFLSNYFNKKLLLETFLISVRSGLLDTYQRNTTVLSESILLMAAIGLQCFNNEYIWYINSQEAAIIDQLKIEIEENCFDEKKLFVYAMYRSLHRLKNANIIAEKKLLFGTHFSSQLLLRTLLEPLQEDKIKLSISSFGSISNEVSIAVRDQYEESPYPRWTYLSYSNPLPFQEMIESKFPSIKWSDHFREDRKQILIAGCGTGRDPIRKALGNPDADVLAVDLSKSSLAYAIRMANHLGVKNISFLHADILELPLLKRKFHYIVCPGVIHHMQDQEQAWSVLDSMLVDGGILHIGVYSKVARMKVTLYRNKIKKLAVGSSPESIVEFRHQLINDRTQGEFLSKLLVDDFFSTSMLRDFLFHASEYQYSIDELANYMEDYRYQFIFFWASEILEKKYRQVFPEDPNFTNLENWKKFEKNYATTYCMYHFWAQKNASSHSLS